MVNIGTHCRHNVTRQLFSTKVIFVNYMMSKDNIMNMLKQGLNKELVKMQSR